ncbi:T-cell surface glycoprotein CD3 delta chain-like [Platichthys flesus]|uniref:T-cell surface glycoprotein CD3 delta chain-like n=1 Tax=Platichthys flesus TaxID=8260 RepID=UPI002DBCB902|nr:T-cell surface glycoprotein CD3 delta chain-like [Platichthys flesus]XP_062241146.1 T-cell surface glycoprotein CD3 delta chain-like [Platichthys flesus]
MIFKSFVPACLLLLWTLPDTAAVDNISVSTTLEGIKLTCRGENAFFPITDAASQSLLYKDENTGEYHCIKKGTNETVATIFVKFRTCDTCIELDPASIAGIAIGDAVATIVLGVAVYLVASRPVPVSSNKKTSNRQPPAETRSRAPNDPYQRLRFKNGARKDEYDVIGNAR